MFIQFGKHKIDVEKLAAALGEDPANTKISLCMETNEGTLSVDMMDYDHLYKIAEVSLILPEKKRSLPVVLTRAEVSEDVSKTGEPRVRSYLFGRDPDPVYVAYTDADTRSDYVVERNPKEPLVVVSGDRDFPVAVTPENQFIKFTL